ncbi:SKP1-like protein 11 [Drosophila grimshawi]|uniref:GH16422 n=1 Tax=Drosophila grimshawi TaxID=7222 RepID=B4IZV4_DROGR|nr:SKP1-like protein 11 [Drosophila grimshawi]EDV96726.1 GH16422 [Drosophila grimshawi]
MCHAPQSFQIRTSDDILFDVNFEVAQQIGLAESWLLHGLRESNSNSDICDANIVPLDRVSSHIFRLVLKWCQELLSQESTVDERNELQLRETLHRILTEANANDSMLFELIIAADYLNIDALLQTGTQYVADVITGCSTIEAIRERWHTMHHGAVEEETL